MKLKKKVNQTLKTVSYQLHHSLRKHPFLSPAAKSEEKRTPPQLRKDNELGK